jgi:hypothetical protein
VFGLTLLFIFDRSTLARVAFPPLLDLVLVWLSDLSARNAGELRSGINCSCASGASQARQCLHGNDEFET